MVKTDLGMQVWVGCLVCYNAGTLHGEWLDADNATSWQCDNPTHEEMWCFDIENMPVREEMSPSTAEKWAAFVQSAEITDDETYAAFRAWIDNDGTRRDPESIDPEGFREAYQGTHASERDFAEELAEDLGYVSQDVVWPYTHIAWDAASDELFRYDYWSAETGEGTAVFRVT